MIVQIDKHGLEQKINVVCTSVRIFDRRVSLRGVSIEDMDKMFEHNVALSYDVNGLWIHNDALIVILDD